MPLLTCYHGTDLRPAQAILDNGVDPEAKRRRDPGDLGWGFYLSTILARASLLGEVTLACEIETDGFAYIPNPYFADGLATVLPTNAVEKLFHDIVFDGGDMLTVRGDQRIATAREVRDTFLAHGYAGIRSDYGGEIVAFDPAGVLNVRIEDDSYIDDERLSWAGVTRGEPGWLRRFADWRDGDEP